jgi:hypothetical protein
LTFLAPAKNVHPSPQVIVLANIVLLKWTKWNFIRTVTVMRLYNVQFNIIFIQLILKPQRKRRMLSWTLHY